MTFLCLSGLVICSYLTQNLLARSYLLKKPSTIMPFTYITIVLSFIVDYFYFDEKFDILSIFGMLLTSSGLLIKIIIK